jgi:hypothetical protein
VADAGKVGGEAVEVVLAPFLERMVVAAGTFQPDAEEELADDRGQLRRLAAVAEEHGRAVVPGRTLRRDQLADELIVGLVAAEAVANPGVVVQRLDADMMDSPQQVGSTWPSNDRHIRPQSNSSTTRGVSESPSARKPAFHPASAADR